MIYDEGMSLYHKDTNNYQFITFFYYTPNKGHPKYKSKWLSHCHSTIVGWYSNKSQFGCFYGLKNVEDPYEVTNGDVDGKLIVTAERIEKVDNTMDESSRLDLSSSYKFLETKSTIRLTALTTNLHEFVQRINDAHLPWKAKMHERFRDLRLNEINTIAGRLKVTPVLRDSIRLLETGRKIKNKTLTVTEKDAKAKEFLDKYNSTKEKLQMKHKTLPKGGYEYSWDYLIDRIHDQKNCGSCFALANLLMVEARLKINYPDFPPQVWSLYSF